MSFTLLEFTMSRFSNLILSTADDILTVSVNRPEKLNALNLATLDELKMVFESLLRKPALKGVILMGEGEKSFVAGADISEFQNLTKNNGRKFATHGQEIFNIIEQCPVPVIAIVNGYALGGGLELALSAHIRIGTPNALVGLPEVTLGIIPGYGGSQRLVQTIGKSRALEMMLTGEKIDAQKALDFGLLNYLAKNKNVANELATEIVNKISKNAPLAVEKIINCANVVGQNDVNGFEIEAESFAECCETSDFKEGTSAFLEKRAPNFTGK